MSDQKSKFSSEAMLCATFIAQLPKGWTAYPETAGFDILLSRDSDGAQVGIEAKLTLNAKVIEQIVESAEAYAVAYAGPDYRAVLVPWGTAGSLGSLCRLIGIVVVEQRDKQSWEAAKVSEYRRHPDMSRPSLPDPARDTWWEHRRWTDWAPATRCKLPDYIPDVRAGSSAPVQLTDWKVKAIKIAVIVEKVGFVTRADFKAIEISHYRWIQEWIGWLGPGAEKGQWIAGPLIGNFKAQHPRNYDEIAADYEKWKPAPPASPRPAPAPADRGTPPP